MSFPNTKDLHIVWPLGFNPNAYIVVATEPKAPGSNDYLSFARVRGHDADLMQALIGAMEENPRIAHLFTQAVGNFVIRQHLKSDKK